MLFVVGRIRGNLREDTSMIVDSEFQSTFTTLESAKSHQEQIRVQGSTIAIDGKPCVAVQSKAGDQLIIVSHDNRVGGFAACQPQLRCEWRMGEFAKVIMSQSSVQVLTTKDELRPADLPIFDDYGAYDTAPAIDLVCRLSHWLRRFHK